MALHETPVPQTEQVMQALFPHFLSFSSQIQKRALGNHSLVQFFKTVFVRLTAAACLGMQGNALQPARLLDRESCFPTPASLEKESCNLSSFVVYFWCCFSSFCLQQWSFQFPIFFLNLVFRERKKKKHQQAETWAFYGGTRLMAKLSFFLTFLLCLNSLW